MAKKKSFQIRTLDGSVNCLFFTTAKNHKEALKNLIDNSLDFNSIVKDNKDLTITVNYLYPKGIEVVHIKRIK